jgi:CRISPR-associated protein Cas1
MQWLAIHPETEELTKEFKAFILQIATKDVKIDGKPGHCWLR